MSHQIRNGAFSVVIKKCPLASIVLVRIFLENKYFESLPSSVDQTSLEKLCF